MSWSDSFVSRCVAFLGAGGAARDDRIQAVELLVRVEVDDEAPATTGANDADLGGQHATQLGFEVLQVGAEAASLPGWLLLALSAHELLSLPNRKPALQHHGQDGPLQLGDGDGRQRAAVSLGDSAVDDRLARLV